jgi:O-antigen ligase
VTQLSFLIALVPSTLLAYSLAPSATVLNQIAAAVGWALVVGTVGALSLRHAARATWVLAIAVALLVLAALAAHALHSVATSMTLPPAAALIAAGAVMLAGAAAARAREGGAIHAFLFALVVVGVANVAISLLQVFLPDAPDGSWIARSGLTGRAVGNLRQPNHLSSLGLWSAVAVIPLLERQRLRKPVAATLFGLFIFSVELSASRTGMVGVVVLALWGALDKRLSGFARATLLSGVLVYGAAWALMVQWAEAAHQTFGAAARLGGSDPSSSRFGIWSNTLELIRQHPLAGVGFGDFNLAWTLSPFPGRPTAFFDHTHNAALQFLVELGIPAGGVLIVLFGVALWQAWRRSWSVNTPEGVQFRALFVVVLLVLLHSQLEYPLWYAYFLLPAAWAWGCCLGAGSVPSSGATTLQRLPWWLAGGVMALGAAVALHEYVTVSRIFEPAGDERPLPERIADGRKSIFFGHHADYAAVTVAEHPSTAWQSFATAPHYLLDTRLMIAWATAFAERGDLDRARYVAQRLREFKKEDAAEFFAPCSQQPPPVPLPFQCEQPTRAIDWREFRDPALYR